MRWLDGLIAALWICLAAGVLLAIPYVLGALTRVCALDRGWIRETA
jgi:hypothetical protein